MPKLKKLRKSQAGFVHWLLLLSLVVVLGVTYVGYRVFTRSHADVITGLSSAQNSDLVVDNIGEEITTTPTWDVWLKPTAQMDSSFCTAKHYFQVQSTTNPADDNSWTTVQTIDPTQSSDVSNHCPGDGSDYFVIHQPVATTSFYVRTMTKSSAAADFQLSGAAFQVIIPQANLTAAPTGIGWTWNGTGYQMNSSSYTGLAVGSNPAMFQSTTPDMSNPVMLGELNQGIGYYKASGLAVDQSPQYYGKPAMYYALYTLNATSDKPVTRMSNILQYQIKPLTTTNLNVIGGTYSLLTNKVAAGKDETFTCKVSGTGTPTYGSIYTGNFTQLKFDVKSMNNLGQEGAIKTVYKSLPSPFMPGISKSLSVTVTAPANTKGAPTKYLDFKGTLYNGTNAKDSPYVNCHVLVQVTH